MLFDLNLTFAETDCSCYNFANIKANVCEVSKLVTCANFWFVSRLVVLPVRFVKQSSAVLDLEILRFVSFKWSPGSLSRKYIEAQTNMWKPRFALGLAHCCACLALFLFAAKRKYWEACGNWCVPAATSNETCSSCWCRVVFFAFVCFLKSGLALVLICPTGQLNICFSLLWRADVQLWLLSVTTAYNKHCLICSLNKTYLLNLSKIWQDCKLWS